MSVETNSWTQYFYAGFLGYKIKVNIEVKNSDTLYSGHFSLNFVCGGQNSRRSPEDLRRFQSWTKEFGRFPTITRTIPKIAEDDPNISDSFPKITRCLNRTNFDLYIMYVTRPRAITYTYWLGWRARRENIWLEVMAYGPSAAGELLVKWQREGWEVGWL